MCSIILCSRKIVPRVMHIISGMLPLLARKPMNEPQRLSESALDSFILVSLSVDRQSSRFPHALLHSLMNRPSSWCYRDMSRKRWCNVVSVHVLSVYATVHQCNENR